MKNYIKNIIGIILLIVFLYFKFDGFHDFVNNNVLCHFFDVENHKNVKVQIDLLGLAKDNQRTHSGGDSRPRGCWAQSGVDDDVNVENSEVSNEWVRPEKGVANIRSNVYFTSSKDHRQVISISTFYHNSIERWTAFSNVGKYMPGYGFGWHVYKGENDKYWVFSECEMFTPNSTFVNIYEGYDLYIAKDWSHVGISNDPNVIYDEMISDLKFSILYNESSHSGYNPQGLRMANMEAMAQSLHNQNQADLERMYNEADAKIDEINHQSVERYKSYNEQSNSTSNGSTVRGKRYAPDYTGGKYMYWCTECGSWGAQHTHFDLK